MLVEVTFDPFDPKDYEEDDDAEAQQEVAALFLWNALNANQSEAQGAIKDARRIQRVSDKLENLLRSEKKERNTDDGRKVMVSIYHLKSEGGSFTTSKDDWDHCMKAVEKYGGALIQVKKLREGRLTADDYFDLERKDSETDEKAPFIVEWDEDDYKKHLKGNSDTAVVDETKPPEERF